MYTEAYGHPWYGPSIPVYYIDDIDVSQHDTSLGFFRLRLWVRSQKADLLVSEQWVLSFWSLCWQDDHGLVLKDGLGATAVKVRHLDRMCDGDAGPPVMSGYYLPGPSDVISFLFGFVMFYVGRSIEESQKKELYWKASDVDAKSGNLGILARSAALSTQLQKLECSSCLRGTSTVISKQGKYPRGNYIRALGKHEQQQVAARKC